jgi:hypothetical protein
VTKKTDSKARQHFFATELERVRAENVHFLEAARQENWHRLFYDALIIHKLKTTTVGG